MRRSHGDAGLGATQASWDGLFWWLAGFRFSGPGPAAFMREMYRRMRPPRGVVQRVQTP